MLREEKKVLTISEMTLSDNTILKDLTYDGSAELFYTQLMLRDFMMFGIEESGERSSVMVDGESITFFRFLKESNESLKRFTSRYLGALEEIYADEDLSDDWDPTPPRGPKGPKGSKRGHLTIIK